MMAYLVMMAVRLKELHRVLKPTGSLYLHCDPTASHYLKILLDTIFGAENYRNEIIWRRSNPKSHITKNFPNSTDTIFRYTRSEKYLYIQPYEDHDQSYVDKAYKYSDENGRYRLLPLLNPNDNRPNLTYEFLGVTRVWRWTRERMEESYRNGLVVQLKPGAVPQYKKYLEDSKGRTVTNLWTDIEQAAGSQNLGYPTQKPVALLERIISASSNEGDVVLDPFCGCGTTIAAAQKLNREWIGIDVTHLSVGLQKLRLKDSFGLTALTQSQADKYGDKLPPDTYKVVGQPEDIGGAIELAARDKYGFQWWVLPLIGAKAFGSEAGKKEGKKGADGGIDGLIVFTDDNSGKAKRVVVSVKGGGVNVAQIRDLAHVVDREKAAIGVFLSLEPPTKPMLEEAVGAGFYHSPGWNKDYPKIQILTVEELLGGKTVQLPPNIGTYKQAGKIEINNEKSGNFTLFD